MSKVVMKRYDAYKDSGVEWLGKVPEHWELKRIKEISEINKRTLSEKTSANYEFNYVDIGSVTYGAKEFVTERLKFDIAPSRAKRVVKKGDTIISTVRTYLKAIASIDDDVSDLIVSTGFAVISPNKRLFSKYYSHLLTSDFIVNEICALSTGVSYPATNSSVIGDLFCLVPTYAEQQAIANYLDTKTTQIDCKIDLLTQKATQYGKLKQSLINETVTRGLDKTVAMKDSGVEWIGEVPEHWGLRHFKQFSTMKGRIGWQGLKHSEFIDEGPFLITGMNFKGGRINWNDVYHISEERYKQAPEIQLKDHDVLMTKDGTIGKLLYVENIPAPSKASLNSHLLVLRPIKKSFHPRYMYYQLDSATFKHYTEIVKAGTTFFGISQAAVGRYIATLPPLPEQQAIANYLYEKTAHVDRIIETINIQIEKLKELRKTLINDVVTGKIKVA
ncbi:MAG: restriction endonuclease subunit S [Methanosarcinales archaeon]|nr:restriction endonuclease subunit S [Methanosarcinales archaeon]